MAPPSFLRCYPRCVRETDRLAVFADRFYPTGAALERMLHGFLPERPAVAAAAVMLPHAGYVYSGAVAGATLAGVTVPRTVVVLGPKHTWYGAPAAINARGRWRTPLGDVPLATDLAQAVRGALPFLEDDDAAFAQEHSVEVELPFLKARQPELRLVPIVLGSALGGQQCVAVGRRLAEVLARWPEPVLLVASTDMHHQGADDLPAGQQTWEVTRARTARALERVDAMDPVGLVDRCRREDITMCGVLPTAVTMAACVDLGASRAERVAVTDSYAVRPGDGRYTVGYAGYRFS